MDGQTPGDSKDCAYAQRRAVKTVKRMSYTRLGTIFTFVAFC